MHLKLLAPLALLFLMWGCSDESVWTPIEDRTIRLDTAVIEMDGNLRRRVGPTYEVLDWWDGKLPRRAKQHALPIYLLAYSSY